MTWLNQWNKEPKKFIRASLQLIGITNVMKEIDLYLKNPYDRCRARQYIRTFK